MKKMQAYGYIRVSTDEQKNHGFSVEEQREEINLFASRENIEIKGFFIDNGYSAGSVNRPDFQKMLSAISQPYNTVKTIIVRDSSRLIRNLTLKRSISKVFSKYDIKLISLNRDINEDTLEGALHADFMTLIDENELKRVSPRTIKGLRGSALMGNYPKGSTNRPRGYLKVKNKQVGKGNKLIINEEEKDWIIFIFETLATNRMLASDLIKYLKKNNVFGIKWNRDSLYDIIDNQIYYGRLVTNWFDSEDADIAEEYKNHWYDHDHHTVPIVSRELWDATQKSVHHYKHKTKHHYLFSRLVYCIDNDEYLSNEPAWKKKKNNEKILYKYYASSKLKKRINEKKIEEKFIQEYSINQLSEINKNIMYNLEVKIGNKMKRRAYIDEDFDNGFLDEDDYRNQIRELNISILETKKKLENLMDTKDRFNDLNYEKKRAIILSHIERVEVSFEHDTIRFVYIKSK